MESPEEMAKTEDAPLISEHDGEAFQDEEFRIKYHEWKNSNEFVKYRTDGEKSEARNESFCTSLGWICCPKLSWV